MTITTTSGLAADWAAAVTATSGLPAGHRLVARALAERADADGRVEIGRDALAAAAVVSTATAGRALRRLREAGWLRPPPARSGGSGPAVHILADPRRTP
jgi:hypothetical protein